MIRQVDQLGIEDRGEGGALLDRFSDGTMPCPAFACKQFRVDCLSRERMTESELVGGFFHHELGRHQFFHQCEHMGLVGMHDLLQYGEVEASTRHGRQG